MKKNFGNVILLRTPKTGGGTFVSFINNLKANQKFKHIHGGVRGGLPPFSYKYFEENNINCVYEGHFVFSKECIGADLFTIVRDVHSTFFSNLYYFSQANQLSKNKNNIDFISNTINLNFKFNHEDIFKIRELIKNNFITSNYFCKTISGTPYEKFFYVKKDFKINQNVFNVAVNNLKYFKYIGNTNSLDIFFKKFMSFYGFNTLIKYDSKKVQPIDRNFINFMIKELYLEIYDYNHYDLQLLKVIRDYF